MHIGFGYKIKILQHHITNELDVSINSDALLLVEAGVHKDKRRHGRGRGAAARARARAARAGRRRRQRAAAGRRRAGDVAAALLYVLQSRLQ